MMVADTNLWARAYLAELAWVLCGRWERDQVLSALGPAPDARRHSGVAKPPWLGRLYKSDFFDLPYRHRGSQMGLQNSLPPNALLPNALFPNALRPTKTLKTILAQVVLAGPQGITDAEVCETTGIFSARVWWTLEDMATEGDWVEHFYYDGPPDPIFPNRQTPRRWRLTSKGEEIAVQLLPDLEKYSVASSMKKGWSFADRLDEKASLALDRFIRWFCRTYNRMIGYSE